MRALLIASNAAIALTLAAGSAIAGRQTLFEDPIKLSGLTVSSLRFEVPGEWMANPRLVGKLSATGGRNDIEVVLLHAADFPKWEKKQEVTPIHEPGRVTSVDLDIALPGPGRYVLVMSNRFSKITSKQVSGDVALVWEEASSLPAGEALRKSIVFLEPPIPRDRVEVAVGGDGDATRVTFERFSSDRGAPFAIAIQRRAGDQMAVETIGRRAGDIEEIGTVDLHEGRPRDVFVVFAPLDDAVRRDLVLVCPSQGALVSLSLVRGLGPDSSDIKVRYGETFGEARLSTEQSFLERIKSAYGAR